MPAVLAGFGLVIALPTAALTLSDAPFPAIEETHQEPDRRRDSLADPASERLPVEGSPVRRTERAADALAGPDSVLTRLLVTALDHRPQHAGDLVRERAEWALAQSRDGRLVEPLIEALDGPDWRIKAYAAWALKPARDPRAAPHLIRLLADRVWRVRAMAAAALQESLDPGAEVAMTAALVDPAWQVRIEAVGYFADRGGPAVPHLLGPRLRDRHPAVRQAARNAINR
jgi:HEAT repeat protein